MLLLGFGAALLAAAPLHTMEHRAGELLARGMSAGAVWETLMRDGPRTPDRSRAAVAAIEKARAVLASMALGSSAFGRMTPQWWRRPHPEISNRACLKRGTQMCWRSKADMLKIFEDANQPKLDRLDWTAHDTSGTFDAIDGEFELTGSRRCKSLAQAIWLAAGPAPYCLDRINLALLNSLPNVARAGGLVLPEHVYEQRPALEDAENDYYRGRGSRDDDTPF